MEFLCGVRENWRNGHEADGRVAYFNNFGLFRHLDDATGEAAGAALF